MAWFWQIKLDEGAGTTAADSGTGTAVDLTLSGGSWSSIAAGDGYSGIASRAAFGSGNKIFDEANGATAFTLEYVGNFGTFPDGFQQAIWWYDVTAVEHNFSIYCEGDGRMVALSENPTAGPSFRAESATGQISSSTVYALHAVLDQGNATEADRLRIYANGSRLTPSTTYDPPGGGINPAGSGTQCELQLNTVFGDPSGGIVYWAAMADHAATDSECSTRATALLSDNDNDPSGGGGGGGESVTVDHISTLSFPAFCRKPKRDDKWIRSRGGLWTRKAA